MEVTSFPDPPPVDPESVDDFYSMMMQLETGFEPHEINIEFLNIVESSAKDQHLPKKLGHYIACAAVDILPPIVRERLELGPEYNLSRTGRIVIKAMAKLADTIPNLQVVNFQFKKTPLIYYQSSDVFTV